MFIDLPLPVRPSSPSPVCFAADLADGEEVEKDVPCGPCAKGVEEGRWEQVRVPGIDCEGFCRSDEPWSRSIESRVQDRPMQGTVDGKVEGEKKGSDWSLVWIRGRLDASS